MKPVKSKQLDKCMKIIFKSCNSLHNAWSGSEMTEYCNNPDNMNALFSLSEQEYIKLVSTLSSINSILITEKGLRYFQEKEQNRKDFIKNFFGQFITGFLSGIAVTVTGFLLTNLADK